MKKINFLMISVVILFLSCSSKKYREEYTSKTGFKIVTYFGNGNEIELITIVKNSDTSLVFFQNDNKLKLKADENSEYNCIQACGENTSDIDSYFNCLASCPKKLKYYSLKR